MLAQVGPGVRAKADRRTPAEGVCTMHALKGAAAAWTLFGLTYLRHLYRKRLMDFLGVFSNGSSLISI